MTAFNIQTRALPGEISIVQIEGPLDFATFEKLEAVLQKVVREGHTRVGVDCTDLEYMNSRSAGLLVATAYNLREKGGDLKFLHLSGRARTVFDLLGITSIVDIFEDEAALQASFEKPAEGSKSAK
ncbi:MAG: STAS domain-containing protein [Planctomycetota bacterium]|nr:STAS domain-containing protein [Planctomycetota bacterium]